MQVDGGMCICQDGQTTAAHQCTVTIMTRLHLVLTLVAMQNVITEHQVKIRDMQKTSRGVDKHLCSESGARLDGQAGDK